MGFWSRVKHKVEHAAHQVANTAKQANNAGRNLFDNGKVGDTKLFGAGSVGSKILADTSKAAKQAASVAGSVGKQARLLANNPLVQAGLMYAGPYGEAALAGLNAVSSGGQAAKGVLKDVSATTKQKNYSGNFDQIADQIVANLSNSMNTFQSATSGRGAPSNPMEPAQYTKQIE